MQYVLELRQRNKFCMSIGGNSHNRAPHNTKKIRISAISQVLTAVLLRIRDLRCDAVLLGVCPKRPENSPNDTTYLPRRHKPSLKKSFWLSDFQNFSIPACLFVFSISCILCFLLFYVLFLLLYTAVSFLFLYKFTDHCQRVETHLQ